MSTVTFDVDNAFAGQVDLSAPSTTMRELITAESERWRQMERNAAGSKPSFFERFAALLRRH
jgi:hypothetical protein